jgi:hypothetical protein
MESRGQLPTRSLDRSMVPDYPYRPMLGTIMSAEGTAAFRDLVDLPPCNSWGLRGAKDPD